MGLKIRLTALLCSYCAMFCKVQNYLFAINSLLSSPPLVTTLFKVWINHLNKQSQILIADHLLGQKAILPL